MNAATQRFAITTPFLLENDEFITRFCAGCKYSGSNGYCRHECEGDMSVRSCPRSSAWQEIKTAAESLELVINEELDVIDRLDAAYLDDTPF